MRLFLKNRLKDSLGSFVSGDKKQGKTLKRFFFYAEPLKYLWKRKGNQKKKRKQANSPKEKNTGIQKASVGG